MDWGALSGLEFVFEIQTQGVALGWSWVAPLALPRAPGRHFS
jgi:hypothetical protein